MKDHLCDRCKKDLENNSEENHSQDHLHLDDCCGSAHTHTFETSPLGFNIFCYGMTFLAGATLSFLAFQPSKVYKFDIDKDGIKDTIVERYFGRRYFFKGVESSDVLEKMQPTESLTIELMNLRFEAEKKLLNE
ncbi:MAG: hypothetical protein AABX39_04495 [Nanoarchaeota archaeon]